jgi:hypothetical protein
MLKTIGKIIVILLVTAILAGGMYFLVQNSATLSRPEGERPALDSTTARPERFREHDGGHNEASLGRGLVGVAGTLLKFSAITAVVLFIKNMLFNRSLAQQTGKTA